MNGLGIFLIAAAIVIGGGALVMRAENRRDDRRGPAITDADVHVMRLKHGNTWGAQRIRAQLIAVGKLIEVAGDPPWPPAPRPRTEQTSPATHPAPPASQADTGAENAPGTAAAAGNPTHPTAVPPPLPDFDAIREATARAAEQALAETEALVRASYYTPLHGAIRDPGDEDFPLSAPREWHIEMEAEI